MTHSLTDLSPFYTLIRIEGEKAETFFQGQLTCDVREVSENLSRLSAHCNAKGRILSTFRILKFQHTFYFLAPTEMATLIIQSLTPYARFSKVSFAVDETLTALGYITPHSFETSIFQTFPDAPDQVVQEKEYSLIRLHGATPRFIILGEKNKLLSLKEAHQNLVSEDKEIWKLSDIEAGVATIVEATSNMFTPHMINYPELNAVSFKKGCYVGQEVIARTQYLGKAKRHLHRLNVATPQPPTPGDSLKNASGEEVGIVVNSAFHHESHSYEMLSVIQDQAALGEIFLLGDTPCLIKN